MKKTPFLMVDYKSTAKLNLSDERQLKRYLEIAGLVLEDLFKKKIIPTKKVSNLEVSLLICGDKKMRDLNREYREKDYVTDVISFPAHENLRKKTYPEATLFLGDLAICHPQTIRQAKAFSIGYWDEFVHLFIHGVIHLLGYDHELSSKEEKLMEDWEEKALKKFSEIKRQKK